MLPNTPRATPPSSCPRRGGQRKVCRAEWTSTMCICSGPTVQNQLSLSPNTPAWKKNRLKKSLNNRSLSASIMARISLDNPEYYLNRDTSWLAFNRRVLGGADDESNPLLERLKFLAISASNLDEFFEIRVAAMVQQIEDGYNEAGPDGLTLVEKRELLGKLAHEFVDDQYDCWNAHLRPALAENGIRVLGLHELDPEALRFVDEYCEKELDPLLTPVTVDPAHPFPRVINKALCLALLLRRRRRSALAYMGVVAVPRALPRLVRLPSEGSSDFIFLADLVAHHAQNM